MGGDGKPWWAIDTAAWREAFAPFHKLASISERRSTPLPPWSEADVQEFIRSDPVHGPRLSLVTPTSLSCNPNSWREMKRLHCHVFCHVTHDAHPRTSSDVSQLLMHIIIIFGLSFLDVLWFLFFCKILGNV
jgi:hypothetical protein